MQAIVFTISNINFSEQISGVLSLSPTFRWIRRNKNLLISLAERLELLAFFAGYPLVFCVVYFFAKKTLQRPAFNNKAVYLFPLAYALIGTLYWGLQLRNWYPDYQIKNIVGNTDYIYLKIWALFAIIFWLPFFFKRPFLSVLHSLLFFFLLLRDIFSQLLFRDQDVLTLRNEMKVYTDSLLLNLFATVIISVVYLPIIFKKNKANSSRS